MLASYLLASNFILEWPIALEQLLDDPCQAEYQSAMMVSGLVTFIAFVFFGTLLAR